MKTAITTLCLTLSAVISLKAQSKTLVAKAHEKIQKTIDQAEPGDTILIEPGIYFESLYIDKAGVTIRGMVQGGKRARLDGQRVLNDGVIASASHFTIEELEITNYKGNGVMTQGAHHVLIRNLVVKDTGIYGIYPTLGRNIRIENNMVSGIADAGIYIGMCEYVDVVQNEVFENVAGIEIENSRYARVAFNSVHNNTGGILVFALPGLPKKSTEKVLIYGNQLFANNHHNFGAPGSTVSSIPPGAGVIVLASREVDIVQNIFRDHRTASLLIVDHKEMPGLAPDPEVDPVPKDIALHGNLVTKGNPLTPSHFFAWFHYVARTLHAGNAADGALELLIPTAFDIYTSGAAENLCIDAAEGFTFNKKATSRDCLQKPSPWFQAFLDSSAHVAQKTHPSSEPYRSITSFADLAPEIPPSAAQNAPLELGETTFNQVCSGCHALNLQRVGPSLQEIASKYQDNPKGIAAFASNPVKIRTHLPHMPSQAYLGATKLEAAARYILKITHDQTKSH